MSIASASPADSVTGTTADSAAAPARPAAGLVPVRVWDAPVRVAHWLMVACFAGAWLTAESERWRLAHVTLGYTLAALVLLRIVWGFIGTRHARFASFVRGPSAVWRYLRSLVTSHPEHHVGHNPAGALAILALLGLSLLITATGWINDQGLAGEWIAELHEGAASAMLALVALHVGAVVISSRLHHENLARAMVTGVKVGRPDDAVRRVWRPVAALLLVAVLGFWGWQWQSAPAGTTQVSEHRH